MSGEQALPEKNATRAAIVVRILDDGYAVVINRGSRDGLKQGQRFLIYELSPEEVLDPVSGESLGHLEMVKGTGSVTHVQERMATITSDQRIGNRRVVRRPLWSSGSVTIGTVGVGGGEFEEFETRSEPFKSPKIGDRARPI